MPRRKMLGVAARLAALGLLAPLAACGPRGEPTVQQREFDPRVDLPDFAALQEKRSRFRQRTGVDMAPFRNMGDQLDRIFDPRFPDPLARSYAESLAYDWTSRVTELQTMTRSFDVSALPPDRQATVLAFFEDTYRLLPVLFRTSPPTIIVAPDTDHHCGVGTGGCTNGSFLAVDEQNRPREDFTHTYLHEEAHELNWDIGTLVPYAHREHVTRHLDDAWGFMEQLVDVIQQASPDELADAGEALWHYQEALYSRPGTMTNAFYDCYALLSPYMGPADIPGWTNVTDPELRYHRTRLPLFKKALEFATGNYDLDGKPIREHPVVSRYLDAGFHYFNHIMIDPQLTEQPDAATSANPFRTWLYHWKTRVSASRLQLWSLGSIPADSSIGQIRAVLKLP